MKIAITSKGTDLDSPVDPRFGRAANILIIDTESFEVRVVDNKENANAFQGAGIQAATQVSRTGADVLLTGYCGPKAFQVLEAAKIKVINDVDGTVGNAIRKFNEGKFTFAHNANVDAHW